MATTIIMLTGKDINTSICGLHVNIEVNDGLVINLDETAVEELLVDLPEWKKVIATSMKYVNVFHKTICEGFGVTTLNYPGITTDMIIEKASGFFGNTFVGNKIIIGKKMEEYLKSDDRYYVDNESPTHNGVLAERFHVIVDETMADIDSRVFAIKI